MQDRVDPVRQRRIVGEIASHRVQARGLAHRSGFSLGVPIAVYRNRTRSYADRLSGGHGDAAFADYLILATVSRAF